MSADLNSGLDAAFARDGRIRLSLIDIIYGLVIGFGFNFFVDRGEEPIEILLFICCVIAIACDWIFIHQDYWEEPGDYGFAPFIIDLAILLCFTFMIRWAIKDDHHELVLLTMSWIFGLYASWDFVFRKTIRKRGRYWLLDFSWDAVAGAGFYALYRLASAGLLTGTLGGWPWFYRNAANYIPKAAYEHVPAWVILGILLYAIMGPHKISDRLKQAFVRNRDSSL